MTTFKHNQKRLAVILVGLFCAIVMTACEATALQIIPTQRPTETATFTPSPTRTPGRDATPTQRPTLIAQSTAGPTPTSLFGATRTPIPDDFPTPTRVFNPNAPRIEFFTSDPLIVAPGTSVTLFWSARGVDSATIYRLNRDGERTQEFRVPPDGSQTINTRSADRGQLIFELIVGEGDDRVQQTLTLPLQCPVAWFFALPPSDCADTEATETRIIDQFFERGRMVYIEQTDTIYTLFNDGSEPAWLAFDSQYDPEIHAEFDPNFPPQPDRFQPVRELGLLWRGNDVVRNRLGLGLQEQVSFLGFVQTSTTGRNAENVYISAADNTVLHIVPGGRLWQIIAP